MLRSFHSTEIFTIALMIGLASVTLAKLLAPKRFEEFLLMITNSKYLKIHHREPKLLDLFDALLFLNSVIGLSVFGYIIYRHLFFMPDTDWGLLFKFFFGISTIMLLKLVIEHMIADIFEIEKLIDQYLFQKTSYKNYLGLILIPVNAILVFNYTNSIVLIFIAAAIILLISFIGFITSIKTHQTLILPNLFYFILYLCALEIAPYIILYKVLIL